MSELNYGTGLNHIKELVERELGKTLSIVEFSMYYIRFMESRNNTAHRIAAGICNEYYKEKDREDIAAMKAALEDNSHAAVSK